MDDSSPALIERLNQHRIWTTSNLLSSSAALSETQLRETFAIGQGSVWKSLLHMYAAEYVWLEALKGNEDPTCPGDVRGKLPGNQAGSGAIESLAELRAKWDELAGRWTEYVSTLTPGAMDEPVYKVSSSVNAGQRFATRRGDILLHVCLHAHYTTAQVVNMLRQLGVSPLPETMLISLARRGGEGK